MISTTRPHNLPEQLSVFITGAASGIGYAQARAFLQKGHIVYAVDIQQKGLVLLQEAFPQQFRYYVASVCDALAIERAVEDCVRTHGRIDVLCNTAGQLDAFATIEQTSYERWEQIINTNLTGMFNVTKQVLPYLLQNPTSRIINMASIAGLTAGGGGVAYTTTKHAVVGFTKQMAYDYASSGLRINAIAPGAIQTAMTEADFQNDGALAQWVADQTPVRRWAQPEEVAELTLFLASDAADYMQGNIIPMDGGWLIR